MRFLVDECTGPAVARWLRNHSHEVFSVYEETRGITDDDILDKAYSENWILITNDKGSVWSGIIRKSNRCRKTRGVR